ncbi:hypothetical protein [Solicola sp. PLA-1-18]|uniref:hypothetical protein n=1 Tax=Solicola sp. PLA-1-18 TaxID=3380532 RepID=UPI003B7B28A7
MTAVLVVVATAILAWTGFRLRWLALVWVPAAAFPVSVYLGGATWSWVLHDTQGVTLPEITLGLVLGVWYTGLLLGPWVLATAVLRHLLSTPSTRPSYDLDELHS